MYPFSLKHQTKPDLSNIHLFTGCEWNSSFIQTEAGTFPRGIARGV